MEFLKHKKKHHVNYLLFSLIVIAVIAFVYLLQNLPEAKGKYDGLAQCIYNSKATFYGAFWCPHCAEQKALFGTSAKLLPYHECSLPSGNGQNEDCNKVGIESYPTWIFADGTKKTGTLTLDELSKATSCAIDVQADATTTSNN